MGALILLEVFRFFFKVTLQLWLTLGLVGTLAFAQDTDADVDTSDPWAELGLEDSKKQENPRSDKRTKKKAKPDQFDTDDWADEEQPISKDVVADIESGEEYSIQKRTAVREIFLTRARLKTSSKKRKRFWRKQEESLRQLISQTIERQSRLRGILVNSRSQVPRTSEAGTPAVLRMAIGNRSFRVELISTDKNSRLMKWVFPMPRKMNRSVFGQLAEQIGSSVVASVPYKGFVVAKRGDLLRLNIGTGDGLKKGDIYKIFEFDSTTPNFESPKWTVGNVEISDVKETHSFAKVLDASKDVPIYAKVSLQTENISSKKLKSRISNGLFAGVGWTLKSIEIKPDILDSNTRRLQYKSAFSPFLSVIGGYSRFQLRYQSKTLASAFEQVQFQFTELSAEAMRWFRKSSTRMLIAGISLEDYVASSATVSSDSLASMSKTAPFIGFFYQQIPAEGTKLHVSAHGYFPVNVTTAVGSAQGFALDFRLGLSIAINKWLALNGDIQGRLGRYSMANGRGVPESIWSTGVFLTGTL